MMKKLLKHLTLMMFLLMNATMAGYAIERDGDDFFLIANAQDLVDFATMVNTSADEQVRVNARLTADIDLSSYCSRELGVSWTPIGMWTSTGHHAFSGTFDGQGHTISNLYINKGSSGFQGLFGAVDGEVVIKDVVVSGWINCKEASAGVVAYIPNSNCYLTMQRVGNEATVKGWGSLGCGGLVGYGYQAGTITLTDCYNMGTIDNAARSEALIGQTAADVNISCCFNGGTVSAVPTNQSTVSRGNKIYSFEPDTLRKLNNPMQGWVIYAGIGSGLVDNFWQVYDNFPTARGKVRLSDYATTLYIRGAWSDFNPEEGVYVWDEGCNTKPAQRFRMLVEGAKERGLKLAFTFVVDSRDKHYNFTPDYVRAAGAKGFTSTTGSVQVWSPYADDAVFQQKYARFLTDFAARFNNADLTQFVSGFGLGKWGEGHSMIYSTGDNSPRQRVADWIGTLMAQLFTRVPIIINYHRTLLAMGSFTTNKSELDASRRLIDGLVAKGFSLRHDALGMHEYYTDWERDYAASQRFNRPFVGEGGWVIGSHGTSYKNDGYANNADVRWGEFDDARNMHANMLDFRYNSDVKSSETYSWWNDASELVDSIVRHAGYRLYPVQVGAPQSAVSGQVVTINHQWANKGWGYCPTNIPQWNDKFKVAFALLDPSTLQPVTVAVDNANAVCTDSYGVITSSVYNALVSADDVRSGKLAYLLNNGREDASVVWRQTLGRDVHPYPLSNHDVVRFMNGSFSSATGITAPRVSSSLQSSMFNLAGQRVSDNYRGIVIKNGRKMLRH